MLLRFSAGKAALPRCQPLNFGSGRGAAPVLVRHSDHARLWAGESVRTMPEALDIKKVISTSTASVSLDDLNKKGFKQVKVLNQAVITRLIAEAVDKVLEARKREITKEEREKVIKEARGQFEAMAKERLEKERSRIEE